MKMIAYKPGTVLTYIDPESGIFGGRKSAITFLKPSCKYARVHGLPPIWYRVSYANGYNDEYPLYNEPNYNLFNHDNKRKATKSNKPEWF